MAQELQDLILGLKSKHVNWVACLNREDGLGGMPSHEALSVSSQGALEISSVIGQPPILVRGLFSCNHDEGRGPSSQPQYQILTDASNKGWGIHLE